MQLIGVDTRDMDRGIENVLRGAETRSRAFFEGLKGPARGELKKRQQERRGADGEPWSSRSKATLERARTGKNKRRKSQNGSLLGKVVGAYSWTANSDGLVGEHRVPWGSAHHDGAMVGHGAELPARPFAGFSAEFSDEVREAWLAWVERGW